MHLFNKQVYKPFIIKTSENIIGLALINMDVVTIINYHNLK